MAAARTPPRPRSRPRHTSAQVETALRACGGIVAHAAKKLGVVRNTLQRRLAREPRLADVREEALETIVDEAESALAKLVKNPKHPGHVTAVALALRSQRAAGRGWVTHSHVDTTVSSEGGRVVLYVPEKAPLPDDGSGPEPPALDETPTT
jgi:hypothetical protein